MRGRQLCERCRAIPGEQCVASTAQWQQTAGDVLWNAPSNVHVLPGIGHLPMMEAPQDVSWLYAGFLKS